MTADDPPIEQPPIPSTVEPGAQGTSSVPTLSDVRAALSELFKRLGIDPEDPPARVILRSARRLTQYRGPLPPPEMLAEYDRHIPGLAERIVRSWEQQSGHRQTLERQAAGGAESRMDKSQRNT